MTQLTPNTNYNAIVHYEDGSTVNIFATKLHLLHLNYFKGWHCNSGRTRMIILPDLRVFGAECENDYLGRLGSRSFKLLDSPTICKRNQCTNNSDDLMLEKYISSDKSDN